MVPGRNKKTLLVLVLGDLYSKNKVIKEGKRKREEIAVNEYNCKRKAI